MQYRRNVEVTDVHVGDTRTRVRLIYADSRLRHALALGASR